MQFRLKLGVISSALLLLGASAGVSAQVVTCAAGDPVFLAEGPVSAVTAPDAAGVGTITAMGVTFQVPPGIPVATPTNSELGMAGFADPTPFPGRAPQTGFIGATVIANGCVKFSATGAPFAVATDVFSDVNENVLLGAVSANDGSIVSVLGTPVSVLTDARMPGPTFSDGAGGVIGTWTRGGIPVTTESIAVGANAVLEGYFGADGTYHVWTVDVAGGTPRLPNDAQTGITEWRCGPVGTAGRLQVSGGSFTPATPGVCGQTITVVNAADNTVVFGIGATVPTVPASDFCEYLVRFDVAACPANITVLNNNGSSATTLPGGVTPPPASNPVAVADAYETQLNTVLAVAAPGVLVNDTDADTGNTLTAVRVTNAANGAVELLADGSFTYDPDPGFVGTDSFTYQAVDNTGLLSNVTTVTITVVQAVNDPPAIVSTPVTTATVGVQYTYQVVAADPDGNQVTYSFDTAPAGMAIGPTGLITWTPNAGQVGPNTVTVRATDNGVPPLSATQTFVITVAPAPNANLLDLDINRLTVTTSQRVNRTVVIRLRVNNPGTTTGTANARVVGVQNGATVYDRTLAVSSPPAVTTTFSFPDFVPTQTGTVTWTATIADQDPDVDTATATTTVLP